MNLRSSGVTHPVAQGLGSSWLWKRGWEEEGRSCQATLPGLAPGQPALRAHLPVSSPISTQPLALPQESHPVLFASSSSLHSLGSSTSFPARRTQLWGEEALAVVRFFFSPAVQGLRGWPLSDAEVSGQSAPWSSSAPLGSPPSPRPAHTCP